MLLKVWDHQFSTYDKFPEKLFLPVTHQNVSFHIILRKFECSFRIEFFRSEGRRETGGQRHLNMHGSYENS